MKPRTWIFIIVLVLFIVSAILCYSIFKSLQNNPSSLKLTTSLNQTTFYIDIRDYGFNPENFTIVQGERIVWKNLGNENHSVNFPQINLTSGVIIPGANYSVVFNYSGNFTYLCKFHVNNVGKVEVQ